MGMENVEEKSTLTTKSVQVEAAYTKTSRRPATNTNSQTTSPSQTNQSNNTQTTSQSSNGFTTSQITAAATTVKNYVESKQTIPNEITVDNIKVSPEQFLYLLSQVVLNINNNSNNSVSLKNVDKASNPSDSVTSGTLTKSEYLSVADKVISFVNTNNRLPNYVSTSLGKMNPENLIYTFSKILNFYKTNNRLPNTVSVNAWSSIKSTNSSSVITDPNIKSILDSIGKIEAQFEDIQGISDVASFVKYGYGDCWADSMWLYSQLTAAGIQARIMGYVGGGYGVGYRHAWVEINIGNGWVSWDYKGYNSQHFGDVGCGTPYVLIGPGNPNPNIASTGY